MFFWYWIHDIWVLWPFIWCSSSWVTNHAKAWAINLYLFKGNSYQYIFYQYRYYKKLLVLAVYWQINNVFAGFFRRINISLLQSETGKCFDMFAIKDHKLKIWLCLVITFFSLINLLLITVAKISKSSDSSEEIAHCAELGTVKNPVRHILARREYIVLYKVRGVLSCECGARLSRAKGDLHIIQSWTVSS